MEQKTWHFSSELKQQTTVGDKKYVLLPADDSDKAKVMHFYQHHPAEGYGVTKIEVIYNPGFNRAFAGEMARLQEKAGNPAFGPKWESMTSTEARRAVITQWGTLTQPNQDRDYPAVQLFAGWHGTNPQYIDSIFRVGYSNLAFTDNGFFGKGLYSAHEAEYAHRVYSKGALIMNWVAVFSPLPVIFEDMSLLIGKGNYGNYDAHFVPVAPQNLDNPYETVYYPCQEGQAARYRELVVFQTSACLPRYLVHLESMSPLANPTASTLQNPNTPLPVQASDRYGSSAKEGGISQATITALSSSRYAGDGSAEGMVSSMEQISITGAKPSIYGGAANFPVWQPTTSQRDKRLEESQIALCQSRYREAQKQLIPLAETKKEPVADVLLGWLQGNALYPANQETRQKSQAYYEAAYTQKETLHQEALQKGEASAHYHLGLVYAHAARATLAERKSAVEQLTLAAKQNHAPSQRELGVLYQVGIGVEVNRESALYCYQSAAQNGDVKAMYYLALCYAQGVGTAKNQSLALAWYTKAAEQGDALAQNNLGLCYEQGDGVKQDYAKAAHYYSLAAAQGYDLAQHNLAVIYESGLQGVPQDLVKAAQYYHLAASQAHKRAQNNLARFYEEGLGDMPKDPDKAFALYEKSALQNYARAQYNLAHCYECGIGTAKNLDKAKHYCTLAANANERISPDAKKALDRLSKVSAATPFWQPPQPAQNTALPTQPTTVFTLPSQHKPDNKPF